MGDDGPGIHRRRSGRGFAYSDPSGAVIRDKATLKRIRALAIPPAWTDVWISPAANGHIQATGRDARGRKQYRYHPRWREVRDATKYGRLIEFGRALPQIRARIEADLARTGFPREKVLATVVRLLETTFMRVGNEEYARNNQSFGLTTLRSRHVEIDGSKLRFRFRGKSGKSHDIEVTDRRLARLVQRCKELPGQDLFQYLDEEGEPQPVSSTDVNDYLREISGQDFTAKDFRTWAGTLLAAQQLSQIESPDGVSKAAEVAAVTAVAGQLGNTVAVCRKCYIHPRVLEAFLDSTRRDAWAEACRVAGATDGLEPEEAALIEYLDSGGGTRRATEESN